jgi:hypothetical protein
LTELLLDSAPNLGQLLRLSVGKALYDSARYYAVAETLANEIGLALDAGLRNAVTKGVEHAYQRRGRV